MSHRPVRQNPLSAAWIDSPSAGQARAGTALAVYHRHGDALFSLALLLCRDADSAADAVVAIVARSEPEAADAAPDAERRRLAADLWGRWADEPGPPGSEADGSSSEQANALLGLMMFGCHTYRQAAAIVGVSAPTAAAQSRSILRRGALFPTGRTA